jgi:hypothetical protein
MAIVFAAGELLTRGAGYGPLFAVAAGSYLLGVAWIQWLLPRIVVVARLDEASSFSLGNPNNSQE